MIAQRVGLSALRQGAAKPSVFLAKTLPKAALAAGMSTTTTRPAGMAKLSQEEGRNILANQRLNRPISPHLSIYKVEQIWLGTSAWTRITGCTLSGALYVYATAYLAAPLLGWHLETASLVSAFSSLPLLVKGGIKFFFAFPFSFHFAAGLKHLTADLAKGFSRPVIKKVDTATWTFGILGGLALAFLL